MNSFEERLHQEVNEIFQLNWSVRDGRIVPFPQDLRFRNDAVELDATVLYADLVDSTSLVTNFKRYFAAEVYKSYLLCAAKIVRYEGGEITAYDGDRIMAVYIGEDQESAAARAALKISYAVDNIVNKLLRNNYRIHFSLKHGIGVDKSRIFVAKTGIRGSDDLVWVGRAANIGAKLADLRAEFRCWLTARVYAELPNTVLFSHDGRPIWTKRHWSKYGIDVFGSNWIWVP